MGGGRLGGSRQGQPDRARLIKRDRREGRPGLASGAAEMKVACGRQAGGLSLALSALFNVPPVSVWEGGRGGSPFPGPAGGMCSRVQLGDCPHPVPHSRPPVGLYLSQGAGGGQQPDSCVHVGAAHRAPRTSERETQPSSTGSGIPGGPFHMPHRNGHPGPAVPAAAGTLGPGPAASLSSTSKAEMSSVWAG